LNADTPTVFRFELSAARVPACHAGATFKVGVTAAFH
jgi:hypothetical protein